MRKENERLDEFKNAHLLHALFSTEHLRNTDDVLALEGAVSVVSVEDDDVVPEAPTVVRSQTEEITKQGHSSEFKTARKNAKRARIAADRLACKAIEEAARVKNDTIAREEAKKLFLHLPCARAWLLCYCLLFSAI